MPVEDDTKLVCKQVSGFLASVCLHLSLEFLADWYIEGVQNVIDHPLVQNRLQSICGASGIIGLMKCSGDPPQASSITRR